VGRYLPDVARELGVLQPTKDVRSLDFQQFRGIYGAAPQGADGVEFILTLPRLSA
jgi:hypothetical protein